MIRALFTIVLLAAGACHAAERYSHADDIPPWFQQTFLDLRADIKEAANSGRRVMIYFGQDGCPYCTRLVRVNFTQKDIVDTIKAKVFPIALDLFGDREVTWLDGKPRKEKDLARDLKVQFTPTILFFDEGGKVIARINGYYPPHKFRAALDYVTRRLEKSGSFDEHMRTTVKEPARSGLNDAPFAMPPPVSLARGPAAKPLAVFFEQAACRACDEMHAEALKHAATLSLLGRYDVARLDLFGKGEVKDLGGRLTTEAALAKAMAISYTPSVLLFESDGREIIRLEGYVRRYHLQSALEYVASGAWREWPSFQRYIQGRAEAQRERGEPVVIW